MISVAFRSENLLALVFVVVHIDQKQFIDVAIFTVALSHDHESCHFGLRISTCYLRENGSFSFYHQFHCLICYEQRISLVD